MSWVESGIRIKKFVILCTPEFRSLSRSELCVTCRLGNALYHVILQINFLCSPPLHSGSNDRIFVIKSSSVLDRTIFFSFPRNFCAIIVFGYYFNPLSPPLSWKSSYLYTVASFESFWFALHRCSCLKKEQAIGNS